MNTDTDVHIYAIGSFGASVADVLRVYIPTLTATYGPSIRDILDQLPSPAAIHVLAVVAPEDADCADFTRLCYTGSCTFVPLTLQPGSLWLGPVTGPQLGPCWNCAMRRHKQHADPSRSHDLRRPEPLESITIPGGLLPLVATGVWHLLHVSHLGLLPQGLIWRMDLESHEISEQKVMTIHRCDFCGLVRKNLDVAARQMRDALSYLYSKPTISI